MEEHSRLKELQKLKGQEYLGMSGATVGKEDTGLSSEKSPVFS